MKSKQVIGIGLTLMAGYAPMQTAAQKKPNLLFIMTDQQRFDALGIAGNTVLKTPNLDRLAKQGVWFKNAYTQCAVCAPTRESLLTGCTVENHQILTNELSGSTKETGLMPMPTYDEILSKNGYRCEYFGKWHSPEFHAEIYQNPVLKTLNGKSVFAPGGLTAFYLDYLNKVFPKVSLKPGEMYDSFTDRPYVMNPLDKRYGMTPDQVAKLNINYLQPDLHGELLIPAENSFTAFYAGQTIEALERNRNNSFSITCSFHFPHAPMLPVKPYSEMYPVKNMPVPESIFDPMLNSPYRTQNGRLNNPEYADPEKIKYMIADYYALISEIDVWVGKIMDKLTEIGLNDNTLVIFTSDHGEMLGSHGMREKNIFYEESAHIPLMIRFPGKIKPDTKVEGYLSNMNLFATIFDYLQLPEIPSDAKSLRGMIEGTDQTMGKFVVTEWLYNEDRQPAYMIVKDNWKMFIPYSAESKVIDALYDLNKDPYEMNNLIGNNPDRKKFKDKANELREDILSWLKEHKSAHYEGVKSRDLMNGDLTTGIIQTPVKQFRIFPNPSSGKVTLDSNDVKVDGIKLYNMLGQNLYNDFDSFTGQKIIDLSLTNGIYLIKVISKDQFPAHKITIQN
jgi:arylsulfatase A-like enzyme